MPRLKDQAICIRLIDWSETSQVVALLTREHGKLRGLAKGSKRTSPGAIARYSGGIELLTLGQVVGAMKPNVELVNITEWDLQEPYRHLRTDLEAHQLGLYAADLVSAMLADHDAHPVCFAALQAVLGELADPAGRAAGLLQFQWRVLDDCGYRPRLDLDAQSGAAFENGKAQAYVFDPRSGGLTLTPSAGDELRGPWKVRAETVEVLRAAAAGDTARVTQADPAVTGRANRLLCVYIRAILDRELPTMRFVLQ